MFANIFGNYLIKKKIITEDEFLTIKMHFDRTRVKLGLIAVSEKLMTEEQAEEVNRKQQLIIHIQSQQWIFHGCAWLG